MTFRERLIASFVLRRFGPFNQRIPRSLTPLCGALEAYARDCRDFAAAALFAEQLVSDLAERVAMGQPEKEMVKQVSDRYRNVKISMVADRLAGRLTIARFCYCALLNCGQAQSVSYFPQCVRKIYLTVFLEPLSETNEHLINNDLHLMANLNSDLDVPSYGRDIFPSALQRVEAGVTIGQAMAGNFIDQWTINKVRPQPSESIKADFAKFILIDPRRSLPKEPPLSASMPSNGRPVPE